MDMSTKSSSEGKLVADSSESLMCSASSSATAATSAPKTATPAPSRGLKYLARPRLVLYRFLDVIKEKHNLTVEIVNYVSDNLTSFLSRHWHSADMAALVEQMRSDSSADEQEEQRNLVPVIFNEPQPEPIIRDSVYLYVMYKCRREQQHQLDLARGTRSVQSLVHWLVLEGFLNGTLHSAVPAARLATFQHCQSLRLPQIIFSSITHVLYHADTGEGQSVERRLLSHTDQGDLTGLFQYLDMPMNTRKKSTYASLAQMLSIKPTDMLLVTFSETEARKASRAGFRVVKIRQHNQPKVTSPNIILVNDVAEIRFT